MISHILPISSLLGGMGILLAGSGLLGTLLGLRGALAGFSDLTIGVVMAAFFLGYVVGARFCPPIIARVGHVRAFAAFAAASAAISLAYGLYESPYFWAPLRIANGIALVGVYMVIESWLNERATDHRAQIFSAYMMVSLIALALGQYLLLPFGTEGLGSFLMVGMLFCIGLIPIALTPVPQPVVSESVSLPLKKLYERAPVGAVGGLVSGMVIGSFWALTAAYGSRSGLDTTGVANLFALAIVGGALLQWPIGKLSDSRDRRMVLVWVALAGAAACLLMQFARPLGIPLPIAGLFFGSFAFSLYGIAVAQTHDRFHRRDALEATKSLLFLHGAGAIAGPLVAGLVMSATSTAVFPAVLALMQLGLAGYAAVHLRSDPPVPIEDRSQFLPMNRSSPVAMDLDPRSPSP